MCRSAEEMLMCHRCCNGAAVAAAAVVAGGEEMVPGCWADGRVGFTSHGFIISDPFTELSYNYCLITR